jgi:hypothetical protein
LEDTGNIFRQVHTKFQLFWCTFASATAVLC